MKLSMWMIAKWFEADRPLAVIMEGTQAIEGVRLYADDDLLDSRFLYVCRTSDMYSGNAADQVLVVFRNDTLSFTDSDPNTIFNRVIEAFEFYNDWERRLLSAVSSPTPEQDIVDSCKSLLGPIFIMDSSMGIVASTSGYLPGEINDFWDIVILGQGLPDIGRTVGSNFSRMHFVDHECTAFVDESAAPYSYGISASIHGANGAVMGQMVVASNMPMGPYEMQLTHMVAVAIDSVRSRRLPPAASGYAESILADLLDGRIDCAVGSHKLMLLQEWQEDDAFFAIRVEPNDTSDSGLSSLKRLLALEFPEGVMLIRNAGVEGLIRILAGSSVPDMLKLHESKNTMRIGSSNEFHNLEQTPLYMRQSKDALNYSPLDQTICFFRAQSLAVMTHASERDYALCAAHPAVGKLRAWDNTHRTLLSATLRCFLEHERSYTKTAKALFVHRNTVLYRVEKACEIASLNIEDPYERLYLMVSFLVCDDNPIKDC